MNEIMETAMAEATRLTRMGQLLDATALIQRTLGGTPTASSTIPAPTADEPVDVSFRVLEPNLDTPHTSTSMATLPGITVLPYPAAERTSARLIDTVASRNNPSRAQSKIGATWANELAETRSGAATEPANWQARLRIHLNDGVGRSEIWAGGQFIEGSYTNKAGTRAYKLYVPKGYCGQPLPLVVMLHGCTQNPDDFAAGTRMNVFAEREQFLVVYPAQKTSSNQSKCWKWFNATDQQRERGEPSIIAGITRKILSTYHCDARRVYVAGLSAGGAMAVIMGVSYSDLYTAIGVHSGLPYGAALDLPSALAAMKHGGGTPAGTQDRRLSTAGIPARAVPTIVFHGDRDRTVHPRNGDHVLAQLEGFAAGTNLHKTVKRVQVANRHGYTHTIYHDAAGDTLMERWLVHGAGHAWSGGSPHGSFTDPKGPDASQEMVRFFLRTSTPR
jgi:poly(hydroxyalkanoate) depolymerase family esterase